MAFPRRKTPTPTPKPPPDPRTVLARALIDAGQAVSSACAVCGMTAAADDQNAIQLWQENYVTRTARSKHRGWRYHRLCAAAAAGPELVALLLAPPDQALPLPVKQWHADISMRLDGPRGLLYAEQRGARSLDHGKSVPWKHVSRSQLAEIRAAVEQRERELTVPVPHPTGFGCGICGRSHEIADRWGRDAGRPLCSVCAPMVELSRNPRNSTIEHRALDAARRFLPSRATWRGEFPLARDVPGYVRLAPDERREAWSYVFDLPESPLSPEEQLAAGLAELRERLGTTA